MKTTAFALLKLLLALLSLLALIGVAFIPPVTLTLHPGERAAPSLYGPIDLVSWLDRRQHSWRCEYGPEFSDERCGVVLDWDNLEAIAACTKKVTDPDGDGWDWEDGRSCIVYRQVSSRSQSSPFPLCRSPEADIDGDGWGWENGTTCKVTDTSISTQVVTAEGRWPYCTNAESDPDHDGWGWEQEQSCVVRGSSADPNLKRPGVSIAQAPYCNSAASDPDGDGWGWENQRSCVVRDGAVDRHNASEEMPIGVDFSRYHALRIAIQYEGRAEYLRVYLRNFNPAYADRQLPDSTKFMAATLLTKNLKAGPATLPFSDFSVAQWWLQQIEKPQQYAAPEFSNIVSLGFDYVEPGVHKMQLVKVELIGERVAFTTVLYSLCAFWMVFLGATRAWQWQQSRRQMLPHRATGELSQAMPEQHPPSSLERAYQAVKHRTPVGLLVLEIDHLQSIKQHCGNEICADLCTELEQLITADTPPIQHIAPTAEGQFCALLSDSNLEQVEAVAERLRHRVAQRPFNKELKLSITISVGFTLVLEDDAFAEAMKRAEWALFQAMKTRNTICSYPR